MQTTLFKKRNKKVSLKSVWPVAAHVLLSHPVDVEDTGEGVLGQRGALLQTHLGGLTGTWVHYSAKNWLVWLGIPDKSN